MTLAEMEAEAALTTLLQRVEMRHPPFPIRFQVLRGSLVIIVSVPDRDTGSPAEVHHMFDIPPASYYGDLESWLFSRLCIVFDHELRESFHLDGRRTQDPHHGEGINAAMLDELAEVTRG